MDPPSVSTTDEGGTSQDCLRRRRERVRLEESAEQKEERHRMRRQREQARNFARRSEETEEKIAVERGGRGHAHTWVTQINKINP